MNCLLCQQDYRKEFSILEFVWREKKQMICMRCSSNFQELTGELCKGCSRKSMKPYCVDCQMWQTIYPHYDFQHQALYEYNEQMKNYFERYKFLGDYCLRHVFATRVKKELKKRKTIIVPIPLSNQRFSERGFNQVEGLLDAANISYISLLEKEEGDSFQSHKSRKERLSSAQAFRVKDAMIDEIIGKEILLVDDIYTTGRTLFHAYEAIQVFQPKSVQTFSLAR